MGKHKSPDYHTEAQNLRNSLNLVKILPKNKFSNSGSPFLKTGNGKLNEKDTPILPGGQRKTKAVIGSWRNKGGKKSNFLDDVRIFIITENFHNDYIKNINCF